MAASVMNVNQASIATIPEGILIASEAQRRQNFLHRFCMITYTKTANMTSTQIKIEELRQTKCSKKTAYVGGLQKLK